jgi:hypothetical protein
MASRHFLMSAKLVAIPSGNPAEDHSRTRELEKSETTAADSPIHRKLPQSVRML